MKTCGMMGEVVGRAASVCVANNCLPRDVYQTYWNELDRLLRLPGKARRDTVHGEIVIPDDALPLAGPYGPPTGLDPQSLQGLILDDRQADTVGQWTEGTGLKGYVGWGYRYASADSGASIRFEGQAPESGLFEVRLAHAPHENRGTRVPVKITTPQKSVTLQLNMQEAAPENGFSPLGQFLLAKGDTVSVTLGTDNAGGFVHADAVQIRRVEK
jgi:hypothetical protein